MYEYPDLRVVKTKNKIRQVFLELLKTTSFYKMNVMDIVECAEINRGTFYRHYSSKEALLEEIIVGLIEEFTKHSLAPLQGKKQVHPNELRAESIILFDHIYTYATYYKTLIASDVSFLFIDKLTLNFKNVLKDRIKRGKSDINEDLAIHYIVYAILGMIVEWVKSDFAYSSRYMSEQLMMISLKIHSEIMYPM